MPFDEDPDEDPSGLGPPLPPEDRLWRHPSEVGAAGPPRAQPPGAAQTVPPHPPRTPWGIVALAGAAGAVLALGLMAATGELGPDAERQVTQRARPAVTEPVAATTPIEGAAARQVGTAVVRVELPGGDGAAGSGVVYRADGYILTSASLLGDTDGTTVVLSDGRRYEASVVGRDGLTDVGVLHVAAAELPVATLGTATDLRSGEPAMVLAASIAGRKASLERGTVQAVGRRVGRTGAEPLHDMIHTDAATRPTAAGGPLVNGRGTVIGIPTDSRLLDAVATADEGGFATPIDVARVGGDEIVADGRAHHVWLGVEGVDVDPDRAEQLDLVGGAHLSAVHDGSPAWAAGLAADDVIVAVDGEPVGSMSDLVVALRGHEPGAEISVDYIRDGEPGRSQVTLAERGAEPAAAAPG
ncbi:trypsin-like peptidase domain-containing protein [soil metagenome]